MKLSLLLVLKQSIPWLLCLMASTLEFLTTPTLHTLWQVSIGVNFTLYLMVLDMAAYILLQ